MTARELAVAARRFIEGGSARPVRSGPVESGRARAEAAPESRMQSGVGSGVRVQAEENSATRPRAPATFEFWPRAAALLARQALERGLDDLWSARAPRVREASRHAQLLCLGAFVPDEELVSGVRHAWHGLSRACHHQQYELSPTAGELGVWLEVVERFLAHDPAAVQ